jgi:ribose 1,5-bisphosphokinase
MSEAPILSSYTPDAIGPGRLILVVGPSGAGKDTLLGFAKTACAEDAEIVFPRRVVTRQASSSEDNIALTPDEFREALARGDFAMHWEAHGHSYGLPRAIDEDIRARRSVVVNVSRTVIEAARRAYANVVVIAITAPPEVLAERIKMRSRSSDGNSEQRLGRTVDTAVPDVTILNVDRPEDHARRLVRAIKGE